MSKKETIEKNKKNTPQKEVKEEKIVKEEKKIIDNNIIVVTGLVVIILLILLFINFVLTGSIDKVNKLEDVKKVKKVLSAKYNDITCVGSECEYVVGVSGDSLKKTTYSVFNINGRKIATYKIDYSKKSSKATDIVAATDNYIITRTTSNKKFSYKLRSTKGKAKYSSKDRIEVVNDKLAAVREDEVYNIVNKNGKIIISDVTSYETYANGNYINIIKKKQKMIVNSDGDEVLKKYFIEGEIKNDSDEVKYLIVKSEKNSSYSYFDTKKDKLVGDSFDSYTVNENGNVIITKKVNDDYKKFLLKDNGKQTKYSEDEDSVYEAITKDIDSDKYYVYRYGIKDANQKYVVANNKEKRSLGILNVKNSKYTKLYEYSGSSSTLGSIVSPIESKNDNAYVRITCSKYYCGSTKNVIYDLSKNKKIYEDKKDDVIISEFALYNDDYKVIKYSYSSDNSKYAGNSFIYDSKNKEVTNSDYAMAIVDKDLKIGSIRNSSLILYSVKDKKQINKNTSLATKVDIKDNTFFKFTNSKNKMMVYKLNNDKIIEIPASSYLTYTNDYIIYLNDNKVNIYNSVKNKTKTYKLKSNEKLNDEFGDMVNPYRGVTIVNNSSAKNVKVISPKGNVIRKIRNAELSTVKRSDKGNILIIVKSNDKSKDVYGLYVAY